jgi:hypothetical protein
MEKLIKCFISVFLLVFLILCLFSDKILNQSYEFDTKLILVLILAFLLNAILSYILHFIAFKISEKKMKCWDIIKKCAKFLISPDYFIADCFKEKITEKSNKSFKIREGYQKSIFIKNSNWLNILATVILGIILTFWNYEIIRYIIVFRIISRCIEIIVAFGNDVLSHKPKSSSLNKFDRLKLALTSYFEVWLLFAMMYFAFNFIRGGNFLSALFYSLGIHTFLNVDFESLKHTFSYFIYLHIFTVLSLTVLAMATYISSPQSDEEQYHNWKENR